HGPSAAQRPRVKTRDTANSTGRAGTQTPSVTVPPVLAISHFWTRQIDCRKGSARVDAAVGCGGVRGGTETNFPKPLVSSCLGEKSSFPWLQDEEKRIVRAGNELCSGLRR